MNADDLIAAFNELADVDPDTRINRTRVGDAETVQLVPSYNKVAVQRFKALATDAAALFDPAGPGDPETRWLRFVLDHAPELVEDCKDALGHSLGDAFERHDDGAGRCVPFIAQALPNAASASALVVRRCRKLTERAQPGVTEEHKATVPDELVTLDQAAAVVGRSKRSLERYLQRGDLPRPDLPGGEGKAHRWYWNTLRPALQKHFRPDLPAKFPASRVI